MPDIACVNGVFSPLAEARVPLEDRGYQFADGVYEVIVAPDGRPFLLDEHLDRLAASLEGIALPVDVASFDLPKLIAQGIERCGHRDVMIYVQITRGIASRDHVFPQQVAPTVVLTFKAKPQYDPEMRRRGVALMTMRDIRWAKCNIKSIALLPSVLLKNQARAQGYFDALILSDDDIVRETSAANLFIVSGGTLRTPPKSERILHGITRGFVLASAARLGISVEERDFDLDVLRAASEVFITSTTMDIMPVTRVDETNIANGRIGAITERLAACFTREQV
jgi:D-alanine transaminase